MNKEPDKKEPDKKVSAAIDQLDSVRSDWLRRPGVTGVDVGFKISRGKLTDQVALRVHVERKLPLEALEKVDVMSESGNPEEIGGFPVDVVEATYCRAQMPAPVELEDVGRQERVDPLVGGVSIGNPRVTAGTLGAIVWDRTDQSVSVLSNWHVLAGSPSAAPGEPIHQPGRVDGGTASDAVATLTRFRLDTDMDAAIARLNGVRATSRDLVGLNPITGIENPVLGMQVKKSGRTTGLTEGIVDGLSFSGAIDYDHGPNTFHGQIHIVPRAPWPGVDYEVSRGGDSGSVWVSEATGMAVGLHYGGESVPAPASEMALANPMHKVAAATGLDFSFSPLFSPMVRPWRDFEFTRALRPPTDGMVRLRPPLPLILGLGGQEGSPTGEDGAGAGNGSGRDITLAEVDVLLQHYGALRDRLAAEAIR